jgi:hypothetical protein
LYYGKYFSGKLSKKRWYLCANLLGEIITKIGDLNCCGLFNMSISVQNDPNGGIPLSPLVSATRCLERGSQSRFVWAL